MKKRYGIGFLIGMIVFTLVLVCAYQLSYDRAMRKLEVKQKSIQKKQENVIETKGSAQKEEGYLSKRRRLYYRIIYPMKRRSMNIRQLKYSICRSGFKRK